MAYPNITAAKVKAIRKARRVVVVRPRKREVVVDGFKYYKISKAELDKLK